MTILYDLYLLIEFISCKTEFGTTRLNSSAHIDKKLYFSSKLNSDLPIPVVRLAFACNLPTISSTFSGGE